MENVFRIVLNIFGIFVATSVVVLFKQQVEDEEEDGKCFLMLLNITIIEMILDSLFWMIDGQSFLWNREINLIVNVMYYIGQVIFCYEWMIFCAKRLGFDCKLGMKIVRAVPLALGIVLVLLNFGWDVVFYIDDANKYCRIYGAGRLLETICCMIYPLLSVLYIIDHMLRREKGERRKTGYLLAVVMIPVLMAVLQLELFGLNVIWPGITLALFVVLIKGRLEEHKKMTSKLEEQRTRLLVSQMQPHFLYNSLGTIRALCEQQPEIVCEAIDHFSDFLRANMDSLTSRRPIHFRKELENLENFLYLERLRYGEELHIEYDIQFEDFLLPQLTIQPMVENAIKYGIAKKAGGGTVWVRTRLTPEGVLVEVEDNGAGIDIEKLHNASYGGDRSHLGIRNVKERIEKVSNGRFTIENNGGTKVTMLLPR